jgi:hypothetical protein
MPENKNNVIRNFQNDFNSYATNAMNDIKPEMQTLINHIKDSQYTTDIKGNPATTVYSTRGRGMLIFSNDDDNAEYDVNEFLDIYENARLAKCKLYFVEKQDVMPSCIMIDFDIYQSTNENIITENHLHNFSLIFMQTIVSKIFVIEPQHKISIIWTKRPHITNDNYVGRKCYKNGYHGYLYIRTTRSVKRYMMALATEKKIIEGVFNDVKDHILNISSFLDTMSATVPALMFGSVKPPRPNKKNSGPPYLFDCAFVCSSVMGSMISVKKDFVLENKVREGNVNMTRLLSILWNAQSGTIDKPELELLGEAKNIVNRADLKNRKYNSSQDGLIDETISDINLLSEQNPETKYHMELLGLLDPFRYNDRKYWYKVMYVLLSESKTYIPLARYFSMKWKGFKNDVFERDVSSIVADVREQKYNLSIASLRAWAYQDNPAGLKRVESKSAQCEAFKRIVAPESRGDLYEGDIANIVKLILGHKLKTVPHEKTNHEVYYTWYQFMTPDDKFKYGQIYKWCPIASRKKIFDCVRFDVKNILYKCRSYFIERGKKMDESEDEFKGNKAIISNINKTLKRRVINNNPRAISNVLEILLEDRNFEDQLNKNEMTMGVGNGVLVLDKGGSKPELVQAFNNYKVSLYTETDYDETLTFDDPIVKEVLTALRKLHLDDETDVFEYKMMFFSSALDNTTKEPKIILNVGRGGGGKSVFTDLHREVWGKEYCVHMDASLIVQSKYTRDAGAASPHIFELEHARIAIYEEIAQGAIADTRTVKHLTSGSYITARQLFQPNVKGGIRVNCLHFVVSNDELGLLERGEAITRRFEFMPASVVFKGQNEYDPEDKTHRLKDPKYASAEFKTNAKVKSAYLFIMVFYHRKLWKYYNGKTDNIPRPTIVKASNAYFARQDIINSFLTQVICKLPQEIKQPINSENKYEEEEEDYLSEITLTTLSTMFINYCKLSRKECHYDTLQVANKLSNDSIIKKILIGDPTSPTDCKLKPGYVVLRPGQTKPEGSIKYPYFSKKHNLYQRNNNGELKSYWQPETPDECFERVKREYEKLNNDTGCNENKIHRNITRDPRITEMYKDDNNKKIPESIINEEKKFMESRQKNNYDIYETSDDEPSSDIGTDFEIRSIE